MLTPLVRMTLILLWSYPNIRDPNPLDGILPAVKAALTKAYKEGSKTRMVRAADFVTIPGMKKAPKKRIAALLEPSDDVIGKNNDETFVQSEDENSSDTEDLGVQVQFDLKGAPNTGAKKTPAERGRGGSAAAVEKKGGRGSGTGAKRKR